MCLKDHYPEIEIIEIDHDSDYIHMLVSIPPKMSVAKVVAIKWKNNFVCAPYVAKLCAILAVRRSVKRQIGQNTQLCSWRSFFSKK